MKTAITIDSLFAVSTSCRPTRLTHGSLVGKPQQTLRRQAKSVNVDKTLAVSRSDFPRNKAEHLHFHGDGMCDVEEYNAYKQDLKR